MTVPPADGNGAVAKPTGPERGYDRSRLGAGAPTRGPTARTKQRAI